MRKCYLPIGLFFLVLGALGACRHTDSSKSPLSQRPPSPQKVAKTQTTETSELSESGRCEAPDVAIEEPSAPYREPHDPANPDKPRRWRQGKSGSCLFVSLLNSNITMGANDTNEAFAKKFLECLNENKLTEFWRGAGKGTDVASPEYLVVLACKKKALAANKDGNGNPAPIVVDSKSYPSVAKSAEGWTSFSGGPCPKIAEALGSTPKGSATLGSDSNEPTGHPNHHEHEAEVVSVICNPPPQKSTVKVKLESGLEITLTVADDGTITAVVPATGKVTYPCCNAPGTAGSSKVTSASVEKR